MKSTDNTRGQEEFKSLLLSSNLLPVAKALYKVVDADAAKIYSTANERAVIKTELPRGSFVKILQTMNGWSEVALPTNVNGWTRATMLSDIR